MKIIIFGATGSIGSEIVKQGMERAHDVTAFVRSRNHLNYDDSDKLCFVQGDVSNLEDVQRAILNHDAVLCAIGDGRAGKIRAIGSRNIVQAMEGGNVKRLICQTTLGVGDSYNNLNFFWKYAMFGCFLKKVYKDHERQELYITGSSLDYTIIRPSALTKGEVTNQFKRGFNADERKLSLKISRADVAFFMLEQLDAPERSQKIIGISY